MERIDTSIDIHASAQVVWDVLTDFEAYPEWNPFIRSIVGIPREGNRIAIRIQPEGGFGMTFRPVVLCVDAARELRWLGKLFFGGLFDGEHSFVLEQVDPTHTRLRQIEQFNGLLVPLFKSQVHGSTKAGFVMMNEALKRRAESEFAKTS